MRRSTHVSRIKESSALGVSGAYGTAEGSLGAVSVNVCPLRLINSSHRFPALRE